MIEYSPEDPVDSEDPQLILLQPNSFESIATYKRHVGILTFVFSSAQQISERKDNDRYLENGRSSKAYPYLSRQNSWGRKTILTLDGGGVRGYSSLLILKELMIRIGKKEQELNGNARSSSYSPLSKSASHVADTEYLPCHYFDCIAGTSTGGLIAIMLGRLRMSVDQTIKAYRDLSENILRSPSNPLSRMWTIWGERAPRRRKLKEKIDYLSSQENEQTFLAGNRDQCQTILCALSIKNNLISPLLFSSHGTDHHPSRTGSQSNEKSVSSGPQHSSEILKDVPISTLAAAVTAAPYYSRPMKHGFDGNTYHDSARSFSNPSWVICKEIVMEQGHELDCVVSIGCGRESNGGTLSPWRQGYDLGTDPDTLERDLQHEAKRLKFTYRRFDVEHEADMVGLDEWKPKSTGTTTLRKIERAVNKYLQSEQVDTACSVLADQLVKRRIQRAKTMRWESFANGYTI